MKRVRKLTWGQWAAVATHGLDDRFRISLAIGRLMRNSWREGEDPQHWVALLAQLYPPRHMSEKEAA